jgi:DNA replication initiation complex subunit (GINS family)
VADPADTISYEMLQDLLRSERRTNKLIAVPARFWGQVREFLETITQAFRVEQAKDPFSRKVMMLSDQVKNAKYAAEALWALRERKLAMLALAATKDRKLPDGITPDEGALYHDLMTELERTRDRVFAGTIAAPSLSPPPLPVPSPAPAAGAPPVQMPISETKPIPARPVAQVPGAPVSPPAAAPAAPIPPTSPVPGPVSVPSDVRGRQPDFVTIRALGDIPPFVGPDMQTYNLKTGDVATVPPRIADLLVRRQKASIIQVA